MVFPSEREIDLINKCFKVLQFLTLKTFTLSTIENLDALLVREFTSFLFVTCDLAAVLSIKATDVPFPADKKLVVVKLTSLSDVHQCSFLRVAVGKKRDEFIAFVKRQKA